MSAPKARVLVHSAAEKSPPNALTCPEDASEDDKCSYEEERDRRVAKMKELLKPLIQASNDM